MTKQWIVLAVFLASSGLSALPLSAQDTQFKLAQATSPAGGALATGEYTKDPDLRCDILEVKRVSGGALMVRWRIINTAGAAGSMGNLAAPAAPKSIRYSPIDSFWNEIYYIDPVQNKKYLVLTDSQNHQLAGADWNFDLAPGQQRTFWAKFAAPPPNSNKISVNLAAFPPFEDVPVSP
jgi:hypothetical protein